MLKRVQKSSSMQLDVSEAESMTSERKLLIAAESIERDSAMGMDLDTHRE